MNHNECMKLRRKHAGDPGTQIAISNMGQCMQTLRGKIWSEAQRRHAKKMLKWNYETFCKNTGRDPATDGAFQ